MQSKEELIELIQETRPDVTILQAVSWATYLGQLKGCRLFSAAAQEVTPDAWLKARTFGIGGSDIATILDENPWSSPRRIWMSKLNMFAADKQPQQSEAARWGNLLESTIAEEWAYRNHKNWIHIPVTLQSEEHDWMLANVDGFVLSDDGTQITGILEIKTTTAYNEDAWKDGPLPFYYMCQTNWYCGICGLPEYDICCLVGGQHLYAYHLPADPDLFKRETEAAADFWQHNVLEGIEPKASSADADILIEEEHDPEEPPVILQDEESANVINNFCELRDKISALEKIKKALYAQLLVYMGKSCEGIIGDHSLSISVTQRRKVDYDLLKTNFPDAYEACISMTSSASLRIK